MAPAETHAEKRIAFDQNPLRDLEKKADAAHRRRQRAVFTCKDKASSSRKKRKLDSNSHAMMIVSKNPPPLPRDSSFLPFSVEDAKQSVKDWLLHLQEVVPDCYDIHAQSHRKCQCLSYCNAELVSDFVISFCSAHYSQRDAMVRSILWHGDAALDQMRRASKYHGGNHNAGNNNSDEDEEADEELNQALGNNNNTNKGLFQFAPTTSKRVYKLANGNGALQNNLYAIPDCDGTRFCLHGFCNLMWIRRPEQQLLLTTDKKTRPTRLERRAARDKIKAETPEEHLQVRCRLHKLAPAVTSFLKRLAHREGTPMEYPREETETGAADEDDDEDGEEDEDDDVDAVDVMELPEHVVASKEKPCENNAKKRGFEDEELDMMDAEEDDDNDNDDDDDDLCADAEQPRMLSSRFAAVVDVYRTYVFEEGYEIHSRDGRKSNHKVRGDEAWVQSKREPGEVCTPEKFEQLWTSLCPHIVLYRNEDEQQENNKESPAQQQAHAKAEAQDDSNNNKKEEPDVIKVVTWDAASNTLVKSWLPTTLVVEQVVDFLETLALQEGSKKEAPAPKPVGMFNVEDDEDEDDSDEPQIWYLPKRFNVDFVYGLYCNAQGFEKAQRLLLAQPRQDAEWKNSRGNDGGQRRFGTICALFTFKQLWKKYASHVQRARSATATAAAAAAKQESEKQAGSNNNNMDGSVPKPKKPKTPLNVINHEIVPVVVDFLQGLAEREAEEESLSGDNDDEEEEDEQALIQKLVDRQPIYVLPAHYSLHGVYTAFCYHQGVIFKKTRNRYGKYGYGKLTELPVRTDDEWVQSNKPVGLLCTQNFFNKIWDACCSHIVVQQNTSGGNGGGGSGNNNSNNTNNEAAQSEREEQEQQTQIVDEMVAAGTIPPVVVQELHQLRERVQALESNRQRDRVKMRKLKQLVVVAATTATTTGGANDDGGRHPNAAGRYCTHNGL